MNRQELIAAIAQSLEQKRFDNVRRLSGEARAEGIIDVADRADAALARVATKAVAKAVALEGRPLVEGYFTVSDDAGHLTFKVERQEASAKFAPGELIVSRLVGANNEKDYAGVAFAKENGRINLWAKYRGDARLTEALRVLAQDPKRAGLGYAQASKRCYICNRLLTTPESLEAGIGPVCAEKGY